MNGDEVGSDARDRTLMDEMLRAGIPEIKLALGDLIDQENARPLPPRYARLLPATGLRVTLRPDAADALAPVAADLERELTDSCNRHGSLYDRTYKVRLERAADMDAPLYEVGGGAGEGEGDPSAPGKAAAPATAAAEPVAERGFENDRWILVVEGDDGDREVFRLGSPDFTVGRRTEGSPSRADVAISDAPHVSRRQLALRWEEREGAAGFRVYNLGLNAVHLPGQAVSGANAGAHLLPDALPDEHSGWLPPGVPLRIGEHGPSLRIEEVEVVEDEVAIDPDATVFE